MVIAQSLIDTARRIYINEDFGVELAKIDYVIDSTAIDLSLFSNLFMGQVRHAKAATKLDTRLAQWVVSLHNIRIAMANSTKMTNWTLYYKSLRFSISGIEDNWILVTRDVKIQLVVGVIALGGKTYR